MIFTLIQVNKTLHPSFAQVLRPVDCNEEECERKEVGEVRGDGVGGQGASAYSKITGVAVTPTLDGAPSSLILLRRIALKSKTSSIFTNLCSKLRIPGFVQQNFQLVGDVLD